MRKMCKDCLHYNHCINIPDYPVTDHTLGCDDWEKDIREKLKAYEDAEEQGLLLRLPVKIGDTVYIIDGDEEEDWIDEYEVKYFYISSRGVNRIYCTCGTATKNIKPKYIGKTVFFTREAAEQKLKEMEG